MLISTSFKTLAAFAILNGSLLAVTFGAPDGKAHPYVGTLVFQAADAGWYSCSGTLLSPTVMVTAAHCTIDAGVLNLQTWVKFEPVIDWPGSTVAAGHNYLATHGWIKADKVIPHPKYVGSYPNTYDVGLVILKTAITTVVPATLPPLNFLETSVSVGSGPDNLFTVVGYGMQGYIKPLYGDDWERYAGNVRLVELKSAWNGEDMSAKFSNNPGNTSGGSCYGDSGGPVFWGDSNMITAVVSWGNTPCIGVDYQFRLDTKVAQDFIKGFLSGKKGR